jgi:hypothetical protein
VTASAAIKMLMDCRIEAPLFLIVIRHTGSASGNG